MEFCEQCCLLAKKGTTPPIQPPKEGDKTATKNDKN
jgi:hypothetical protein